MNKKTEVKICGITTREDIELLNETQPEYAGFVFFEKSKRNLTEEKAADLMRHLQPSVKKVAVCVSPTKEELKRYVSLGADIIQIHGEFTEETYRDIPLPLWRAVNVTDDTEEIRQMRRLHPEGYLVDSSRYGSGQKFDWNSGKEMIDRFRSRLRAEEPQPVKFILAGGLRPENVEEGIRIFQPDVVDVSSGVEGTHGKDREKVIDFIDRVRRWQA